MLTTNPLPAVGTPSDRRWLRTDELIAVPGALVHSVSVEMGEAWVSFDGQDVILGVGETREIRSDDRILVQATSSGRTSVRIKSRQTVADTEMLTG